MPAQGLPTSTGVTLPDGIYSRQKTLFPGQTSAKRLKDNTEQYYTLQALPIL